MTAPFDDDPAELADRWAAYIEAQLDHLQTFLLAIAVARRMTPPEPIEALEAAYNAFMASLPPGVKDAMLGEAVYGGGPALEDVAIDRLIEMRDTAYVPKLFGPGKHRARNVQPGGTP